MCQLTQGEYTAKEANVDLFTRHCLPPNSRSLCWDFVQTRYSGNTRVKEAPHQGFCSYTLCLGPESIIQFRLPAHRLDIKTAALARQFYGELAPVTQFIGTIVIGDQTASLVDVEQASPKSLYVYSLSRIPGISLAELNHLPPSSSTLLLTQCRGSLVKSFAHFTALSLSSSSIPASSPALTSLKGRIGTTLRWRLEIMSQDLPRRFRSIVSHVLNKLPQIEALPWVLTHGDLVPSNIMVNCPEPSPASSTQLTIRGLLDWAEAEYLPFGVGIYGLEELLGVQMDDSYSISTDEGEASPQPPVAVATGKKYPSAGSKFTYFPESEALRVVFWRELERKIGCDIPNSGVYDGGTDFYETTKLAQVLGILLWHGIAFDDGKLDRVVCEGRDDEEIRRLEVALLGEASPSSFASLLV
ncbi:hypothetical protein B0H66DRAFT_198946 [Apodospora peruviana]|uniref:Aminoglycoside phosphotransferase domain-containing protein n=1 Tax=Apodospora peruviana TaxID=516989 RepID=A0AAE0IDL1_9PEZI|nr:hypothetical protein B0H66DRAFT_198946 [Apodospora peruviana]